ncbi:MAG: formylglycine-generating enzyme family protein [Nitrospira sp.]|nr:formylglycine-generating enzyme family protein [Candidatus Manganitrophaceae bacterium]HIL34623.1 formylglycine-generating enzyme family protein [Candidatus Manganitrophaceae bacterium]
MSKNALLGMLGVLLFLVFLMAVALIVESVKSSRAREAAKKVEMPEEIIVEIEKVDFSAFETIVGGDTRKMVLIPAGSFTMGGGDVGDFDEQPQRVIYLDPFYMDFYEVTNADYKRFTKMLKRPDPVVPVFEDDIGLLTGDKQPVVGVTWLNAAAYCQWGRKRLPTEAEWEKAARGENGGKWPWGDLFSTTLANGLGEEDGYKYSAPVGSFERGRSPYGLYDMAGNVSEWVTDWYDQSYYKDAPFKNPKGPEDPGIIQVLVYRGGSFHNSSHDLRASKRFGGAHPKRGESTVGFRCAKDFGSD